MIKCFYREVCEGSSIISPAKAIWRSKASTKACLLAWEATKGKMPAKEMLKQRNFKLVSRCPMYLQEEEFVDHLFIHYRCVSGLWHLSFSLLGVNWV